MFGRQIGIMSENGKVGKTIRAGLDVCVLSWCGCAPLKEFRQLIQELEETV